MARSASEKKIAELHRQLENEKRDHARTRNELRRENERVWRLVPGYRLDLMGVYPPLRKLLHVLAEAAELQDPTRGAPMYDTMRTDTDPDKLTQTEFAVITHRRYRDNVRFLNRELDQLRAKFALQLEDRTHWLAQLVGGEEWEYEIPSPPICHRKGCPKRGVRQSYTAWANGCAGCQRSFRMERVG